MSQLNVKANSAAVKKYFDALANYKKLGAKNEGAVSDAFADLLKHCARQFKWTLVNQYSLERKGKPPLRMDGVLLDASNIRRGVWEAKDDSDDLAKEVKKKTDLGYPTNNILFQQPERAILLQSGKVKREFDLTDAQELVDALTTFFEFVEPEIDQWEQAVEKFSERIPELATNLKTILDEQQKTNKEYATAFAAFAEVSRQAINPNIADDAVERMLIQHLLTERIFRKIFNNPEFRTRNVIAAEIEKVITALTKKSFSRDEFLAPLEHFYKAIEKAAEYSTEWTEKQSFLIKVYERFFQSFSAKEADTHGIVYTPLPIVRFMVRSVEEILKKEFGRSLSDENVHILDPFVGTGTFMLEVMKAISRTAIEQKYRNELHCNEIMLLPYYIASMNIEHEFFDQTGKYEPFEGICLVDTFELAESAQRGFGFMNAENTARVERQKKAPIFVVIGNPPYNAGQQNESDKNKNRKYKVLDRRVADTYVRNSKATNKNALSDVYVKAIRWASDRLGKQGIVAFVSNNSFLAGVAFDGLREHVSREFSALYHINLKGDARTSGDRRKREAGNVFDDEIKVSVGITFFVKSEGKQPFRVRLFDYPDYGSSQAKRDFLDQRSSISNVEVAETIPTDPGIWLNTKESEFDSWMSIGSKESKREECPTAIFATYGAGVASSRDAWAYSFDRESLSKNMQKTITKYSRELSRWAASNRTADVDEFVEYDDRAISWSRDLKGDLQRLKKAEFDKGKIRVVQYRPFTSKWLYFDRTFNEEVYVFPRFFPTTQSERENVVFAINDIASRSALGLLATNRISDLHICSSDRFQFFSFFSYAEDGSNRQENVTDWALEEFRKHYSEKKITKWDIFHYVYAVLHHPGYRERYAANLKRELPRIPYAPQDSFWPLVKAGTRLMEIHVEYEKQREYAKLKQIEKPGGKDKFWRVEKMKLSKDKTQLVYNEWLTLSDIPKDVYDYRLGNRSALEWVVDQYQVSTDKRSGIVNDPNREDDPQYIYKLLKKVITVSLETVEIVKGLPALGLPKEDKADGAKAN